MRTHFHLFFISVLFCYIPLLSLAQIEDPYEAFKRKREQEMKQFESAQQRSLDSLRDAQNRDFALLLEGKWIERTIDKTPEILEAPKPVAPPRFSPIPSKDAPKNLDQRLPQELKKGESLIETIPQPPNRIDPEIPNKTPAAPTYQEQLTSVLEGVATQSLQFYGTPTTAPALNNWPIANKPINAGSLSAYWKQCSATRQDAFLSYLEIQRSQFHLSDWGVLQLLDEWTTTNHLGTTDGALFKWFWCIQLGYDVRLMYHGDDVVLGYPFREMFYGQRYVTSNGVKYFLLDNPSGERLYTYDGSHAGAHNTFTVIQNPETTFPASYQERSIRFRFESKEYTIPLYYNSYRTAYYSGIPQTAADSWAKSGYEELRNALAAFPSDRQRVRFLYAMINEGIPYATDNEQFHEEKCCLPEEVLSFSHADCEDRTFLLSYLIRSLVGIPTIGLHFPGHVAMAVRLDEVHPEDVRFTYEGADYIYCDPTYLGADIGMMPATYFGVTPTVFE
jgi:hypothetical protein